MNTESGTNTIAAFLRLSRPINFNPIQISTAVQTIPLRVVPVLANRNLLAVISTGFIGTGLAFSALYAGIFNGGHHGYRAKRPFEWLEYPADYVSPVMNLFVEDQVPFSFSSSLSCPKDSEHLERSFDFLRYQHLSKKLGVPSVINQHTPVQPLRILGNTSSGSSFDLLSVAKLLARFAPLSTQGGPQEINGASSGSTGGQKDDDESISSHPRTSPTAIANLTRLPPVSGDEKKKGEPVSGINTASIIVAITIFGLLAQRCRAQRSTEPSTTPENILEVQEAGSEAHGNGDNVFCKDCAPAPVPFKEPSPRLVVAFLIDPVQSIERVFDDDPLAESYIPYVVLEFLEGESYVRSDIGSLEDASAPDGFAARFDALQDALLSFSFEALQNMARSFPRDLARFVLFGMAIFSCFALRTMGFFVTGRFGRRGIRQLIKLFKNVKPSDVALAVEIASDETLPLQPVETPERQEILPSAGGSEVSSSTNPCDIGDDVQKAYERIVEASIISQLSCSTSTPASKTVETSLAPVVHEEKREVKDDVEARTTVCQKGKGKAPEDDAQANSDKAESVEPVSRLQKELPLPYMTRPRGRRGRGRGRRAQVVDDVPVDEDV